MDSQFILSTMKAASSLVKEQLKRKGVENMSCKQQLAVITTQKPK